MWPVPSNTQRQHVRGDSCDVAQDDGDGAARVRKRAALGLIASALSLALSAPPALAAAPAAPTLIDAGSEGGYVFTVEARSVVRDGERVRFRLLVTNESGNEHYDSTIEVDCAHRTRRQLAASADDGQGNVKHYGDEMAGAHPVSQGTRADRELRMACSRVGLQAAEPPHLAAAAADLADAGTDAGGAHAIFLDTVRRSDAQVQYQLQTITPGQANAVRQQFLVDCDRKLRGFVPDDASLAGARVPVRHVASGSREARELALACSLPQGPRSRWFAGFVVTSDGVVVAPHARTQGCRRIVTGTGTARRTLALIANEDDIALLRIAQGGPWPVMPSAGTIRRGARLPVTVLGVAGTEPRVSAAFAENGGANDSDPGWPQVRMLADHALREGIVWDGTGTAVGLALALDRPVARQGQSWVRMLPSEEVRLRLQRHQIEWKSASPASIDAAQAMRQALAATLPLTCEQAP